MIKIISPLKITGIDHDIFVRPHARAKRLSMRVDSDGTVKITTPKRISKKEIIHFINYHRDWIKQQQACQKTRPLTPGNSLPIEGDLYCIQHHNQRGILIEKKEGILDVFCPIERLGTAIKRYLKKQARAKITPLAHEKAEQIGQVINRIAIKDTKTRWGSCSGKNNLNFSWRIIMAPPYVLDYLVAHEVAHLRHMNHSQDFWDLCFALSKDGHRGKAWLRKNGRELQRFE